MMKKNKNYLKGYINEYHQRNMNDNWTFEIKEMKFYLLIVEERKSFIKLTCSRKMKKIIEYEMELVLESVL